MAEKMVTWNGAGVQDGMKQGRTGDGSNSTLTLTRTQTRTRTRTLALTPNPSSILTGDTLCACLLGVVGYHIPLIFLLHF
jgi:hypothetical protein